jgi:hypothetical protein
MLDRMLFLRRSTLVLRTYAVALWLFGWVVLGAIVAPVQFRTVPSPYAAEAMTTIFRRFDTIALACAAIVWMTDVLLGNASDSKVRVAKRALASLATIALLLEAFLIAPRIEDLFRAGAIRGFGPEGETLNAWHRAAEGAGKLQVLALFILLALELVELATAKAVPAVDAHAAQAHARQPAAGTVASSSSASSTDEDDPRRDASTSRTP